MQIQGTDSVVPKSSRYNGPLDCALKTVKTEGVKTFTFCIFWLISIMYGSLSDTALLYQMSGIFRGGVTTLLREAIGNVVFFSTYENIRYYMHLQLKGISSKQSNLIDIGVGILSGGLSGVAVSDFFPFWTNCSLGLCFFAFKSRCNSSIFNCSNCCLGFLFLLAFAVSTFFFG